MHIKIPKLNLKTARTRLFMLVLLVVIPALGVQVFGAWNDLQQGINQRKLESVRMIDHAQGDFDYLLSDTRNVFSDLVRTNEMRSTNNCTQVFTSLRFAYERLAPEATNLGLADAKGNIYCAINPVRGGNNISTQVDFQTALQNLDLAAGVYMANPSDGTPVVNVSYPVLSFDGKVQTVIFASFGTAWLVNWQNEVSLPPGAVVTLYAPDGSMLWRTVNGVETPVNALKLSDMKWFPNIQVGNMVVEGADFDGVVRLNALSSIKNSANLHLGYPVSELYKQTNDNLLWKLALLGLVVIAAFGLAWWASENLFLQPLQKVMQAVKRVQGGDLSARVSTVNALDELATLAASFDQMTDSLQQREAQRQESDARFRAMFETSEVGIGIMSLDRKIIDANPAMCRMLGYTLPELVGQTPAMATYDVDYTRSSQLFNELLQGKSSSYFDERRYLRKNGDMFWASVTMSIVRDAHGQPLYMVGMVIDIDEERRARAKLQESEARFRSMFENSPAGMNILDMNRVVLDINPAMCRMLGRPREELLGQTPALVTHPDDMLRSTLKFQELLSGNLTNNWDERRYIRKNGEMFWGQITMSLVRDPAGQPVYLLGMVIDVSEERRILAELKESEARFRAMFESSAIGVQVLDVESLSVRANQAAGLILDEKYLDRVLLDVHDFIHPDYRQTEQPLLDELLQGKRESYEAEHWYCKSNGVCNSAYVTCSGVRAEGGRLRYVVMMLQDITERKNAQDTLRESEERFRSMFDNAAVGVAVMTLDHHIIQINQAAVRLTGYSIDDMMVLNPSLLAVEEDRLIDQDLFAELSEGKRDQYTADKRYKRKDGSIFWGRVNFSSVRGADGKPIYTIGLIEDITEEKLAAERLAEQASEHRRMLEQRIAERTDELNRANVLLSQKAAQDAVFAERTRLARDLHDAVTQTLFSATLIADVLPEIWEMNASEGKRRLEEVRQLTRGALAEMRTLLVELRPNALVEVPLSTLLRQLTEALTGRARISIQLSAEGERKLPADAQVGLYRIAQEALNNVVKHARATQAVVTLRLGDTVRLTVADNGTGFEPGMVTADHLGLKIMRERADAIGAKFSVYSEAGEGTQISVVWQQLEQKFDELAPHNL